jgi:hypothetical protein
MTCPACYAPAGKPCNVPTDNARRTAPVEEPAVTRDACRGVPYTPDEDSAVQSLVDAGWYATGSKVYPPECGRG